MADHSPSDRIIAQPAPAPSGQARRPTIEDDVVAEVVRGGHVESRHRGTITTLAADGTVGWTVGDGSSPVFPRSCNKPIQAVAMLRRGLGISGELLALACGSHSGDSFHLAGVRALLRSAGLDESALQTPSAYPHDEHAREAFQRLGPGPAPIAMSCSGKHAAMLATCVANGWPTASYLDPHHPLQAHIRLEVERMAGERIAATVVDGCGAPLYGISLTGLARAYRSLVLAQPSTPERSVADAIAHFPEWVSGPRCWESHLLRTLPGAVGKSGAEGCYVLALADGRCLAMKITDGAERALPVVTTAVLSRLLPDGIPTPVAEAMDHETPETGSVEVRPVARIAAP